jgi:hypothetical protein
VAAGQQPRLVIADAATVVKSDLYITAAGANTFTLSPQSSGTWYFWIYNSAATDFAASFTLSKKTRFTFYKKTTVDYLQYNGNALSSVLPLGRYYLKLYNGTSYKYSEWFDVVDTTYHTKVYMTNAQDIGDILYTGGMTQFFYMYSHVKEIEPNIEINGDSRDGVLIKEKITTSPRYRIIDWLSPSQAQAVKLLTGHSTILIVDPLTFSWTPNNVEVECSEESYDLIKTTITFTSGEKVWALNNTNIT